MRYESGSEKIPVSPMQMSPTMNNQGYRQNSDIRRTRRIVLILLAINLVLTMFYFIERIIVLSRYYGIPAAVRDKSLAGTMVGNVIASAISVIYVILFTLVVFKYARIGILIFAWLGLIQLICVVIVIILAIVAIVAASAAVQSVGSGIVAGVVVIIVAAIACILTILLVVFSFKLAKLIKMHDTYQSV